MKTTLAFITAICLAALLTSCASIFNRNHRNVALTSNPSGATFEIKDRSGSVIMTGTTPASVRLSSSYGYFKSQTYTITARKNGKVIGTAEILCNVSPWYWGNFLIGGLAGMVIIDPLTGCMFKLPESVHIGPAAAPAAGALAMSRPVKPGELRIIALADVPPHLRSKLVRL
jgi:hypothetical protein